MKRIKIPKSHLEIREEMKRKMYREYLSLLDKGYKSGRIVLALEEKYQLDRSNIYRYIRKVKQATD